MNIFVLHQSARTSAAMMCDQHVVKMITESAQMLCTLFEDAPYKKTHKNHPCTKWALSSWANYCWLLDHAKALCHQYTARYSRVHKSQEVIEWCEERADDSLFYLGKPTPFAQAMPEEFKGPDAVQAYRQYYRYKRAEWAKHEKPQYHMRYKNTEQPFWLEAN